LPVSELKWVLGETRVWGSKAPPAALQLVMAQGSDELNCQCVALPACCIALAVRLLNAVIAASGGVVFWGQACAGMPS
jgi:hypothetical protein